MTEQALDIKSIGVALRDAVALKKDLETRLELLKQQRENLLYALLPPDDAVELLCQWIDDKATAGEQTLRGELDRVRHAYGRHWRDDRARLPRAVDVLMTGPPGAREVDTDVLYTLLGDPLKARIRTLAAAADTADGGMPLQEREAAAGDLDGKIAALEKDLGSLEASLENALEVY